MGRGWRYRNPRNPRIGASSFLGLTGAAASSSCSENGKVGEVHPGQNSRMFFATPAPCALTSSLKSSSHAHAHAQVDLEINENCARRLVVPLFSQAPFSFRTPRGIGTYDHAQSWLKGQNVQRRSIAAYPVRPHSNSRARHIAL